MTTYSKNLLLFCLVLSQFGQGGPKNVILEAFEALLPAIENVLAYYKKNYENFHFDGIFGLFSLQNQISGLLEVEHSWNAEGDLFKMVASDLRKKLNDISTYFPTALLSVKKRDASYFAKLGQLYQLSWKPNSPKPLYPSNAAENPSNPSVELNETMSDNCLFELLHMDNNRCHLPETCAFYINQPGQMGYQLLHQILIVLVMEKLHCRQSLEDTLRTSLAELELGFCSSVYSQFVFLTSRSIDQNVRDLILEQIFVCGSAGFLQFASLQLLPQILTWQHSSGCFGKDDDPKLPHERKILTEVVMNDGCGSHMTSVAAGALGIYLSAFLTPEFRSESMNSFGLYEWLRLSYVYQRIPALPKLLPEPSHSPRNDPWTSSIGEKALDRLRPDHRLPVQAGAYVEDAIERTPVIEVPIAFTVFLVIFCLMVWAYFVRKFVRR